MIINTNLIDTEGTLVYRGLYDTETDLFLFESGWNELVEYRRIDTVPPNTKIVKWDGEQWIVVEENEEIEPEPAEPTEVEKLKEQVNIMQSALDFIIINY